MTEVLEAVAPGVIKTPELKYLIVNLLEVRFESGIDIFEIVARGTSQQIPPNRVHWGEPRIYPAVYVRQGGDGETRDLKILLRWRQEGYHGRAVLRGVSSDGRIKIEGKFTISDQMGHTRVDCRFVRKPDVVANYGAGTTFHWTVTANNEPFMATGGTPLKLFFVDQKPKPINWTYEKHYLQLIDWATSWAEGTRGEAAVFAALWDQFSDGRQARVPHVTTYSYWETRDAVQFLDLLVTPGEDPGGKGWSCLAIACTFMECLALHGIECQLVQPKTAADTRAFLVQNWETRRLVSNLADRPDLYYGGSWVDIYPAPLSRSVSTSLKKTMYSIGWTGRKITDQPDPLEIDLLKQPGVPGQGQTLAPLCFGNHYVVYAKGKLYDTSYGAAHPVDFDAYRDAAIGGWLVERRPDRYVAPWRQGRQLAVQQAWAWFCYETGKRKLQYELGARN